MRAAVVQGYGPPEVVAVTEVDDPVARKGEVLVRVAAAAVTSGDARIRAARFPPGFGVPARLAFGIRRPRRPVLGGTGAGVVEAVGPGVGDIAVGQVVAGLTGIRMGTHAELVRLRVDRLAPVPDGVSTDDAAAVLFGGTTALHFLRKAAVGEGTSVLVIGASGAVGTNAVQLARHLAATVTGVTSSGNAELVRELGAERIVDHRRDDVLAITERYDVVLDAVGALTRTTGRTLLRPGGRLVLVAAGLGDTVRARGDVIAGAFPERGEDVAELLDLLASGTLRAVIDRAYPLDHVVEAHRLVDTGRKVGNVLVRP